MDAGMTQLALGLANFGVSAVFAVILLSLYARQSRDIIAMATRWTERLAELTEKATAALAGVQAAVTAVQGAVAALCQEVRREDRRG